MMHSQGKALHHRLHNSPPGGDRTSSNDIAMESIDSISLGRPAVTTGTTPSSVAASSSSIHPHQNHLDDINSRHLASANSNSGRESSPPTSMGRLLRYKWFASVLLALVMSAFVFFHEMDENNPQVQRGAAVSVLMAVLWLTEPFPLFWTAMLPAILFPALSILSSDAVGASYCNDTIILFFASFLIAIAMERWSLHKRVSLRLLLMVGHRPQLLLLTFMTVAAGLSMFMSNTATTSLMTPLVVSMLEAIGGRERRGTRNDDGGNDDVEMVNIGGGSERGLLSHDHLAQTNEQDPSGSGGAGGALSPTTASNDNNDNYDQIETGEFNPGAAFLLGIAYSSSIGGTATTVGTGPNLIFLHQLKTIFPLAPEISFSQWLIFALPLSAAFVLAVSFVLSILCPTQLLPHPSSLTPNRSGRF
eukprot:TRINITY_DN2276_c0_g1_i4.p1 TRINITY_DN2276_c0_g1~~TRINITY_DN2276_c0_g1_i4.p1  ORF type:complete len:418 (+),score=71.14 TRINITY_DN2276_c0_g1_i4:209-1462(+)